MTTHARDAIGRLTEAQRCADEGDFEAAADWWVDGCESLVKAKVTGEPKGGEREEAAKAAESLLTKHGEQMADAKRAARAADQKYEAEWLQRRRALLALMRG